MSTSKQSKLQFSVKIPQRYGENCDNTKTFKVKLENISVNILLSKLSYYRKGALETYYLDEALEFRPYFNERIRHVFVIQELFKICFVHQLLLRFPEYNLFGENSETSNNVKEDGFIYFLPIPLDKVTVDAAESEVKFNMNFFDQILVAPLFHNPDKEEQLDFSHEIDDVWMLIPSYLFVNQGGVQLVGEGAVGGRYCLCALNLKTIFTNMRRMLSGYFSFSSLDELRKKLSRKKKSAERRKNKSAERRKKKKSSEIINLIEEEEEEEEEIIVDSSAERSSSGESNYGSGSEWESDWESVDEDIEEEEEEENKSHQLDDHQPNNNIPSFYSSPPTSPLVVSTSIVSTFQKPPNTPYCMSSSSTSSSPHQMRHQQPPRNHSPYPHNNNQPPQQSQSNLFQAGHPQQNQGIMNKGTTTKKKRMMKFQDPLLTPYNPNKSLKEVEDERNSWNQQQKEEEEKGDMMIQQQIRNDQHHPPNYFQSRPPPHISSSSNGQPNQQQQIYQQTNPLPPPTSTNSNQPMNPPPYQNSMPMHLTTNTNSQARGFVQQQPHSLINSWGNEPQPTNHHQQLPNLPPNIFLNRGDHRFQASTTSGLSSSMHQFLLQHHQQQNNISTVGEDQKIIQREEEVHQVKKKRRRRRKKPEETQQIEEISLLEEEDQMTEIILPVDENGLVDTASIMALEKPNTKTKKGSRGTRSKEQLRSDVYHNGRKIRTAKQIEEHKEELKNKKYQYTKVDISKVPQI